MAQEFETNITIRKVWENVTMEFNKTFILPFPVFYGLEIIDNCMVIDLVNDKNDTTTEIFYEVDKNLFRVNVYYEDEKDIFLSEESIEDDKTLYQEDGYKVSVKTN